MKYLVTLAILFIFVFVLAYSIATRPTVISWSKESMVDWNKFSINGSEPLHWVRMKRVKDSTEGYEVGPFKVTWGGDVILKTKEKGNGTYTKEETK